MEKTIKTRLSKSGDQHETKLVIDFTGVSEEQLHELAARSIIIATQAMYRTAEVVPATDTVVVADMLARERKTAATPQSMAKRVEKMSPEQKRELAQLIAASLKAEQ
jgi:hypothetical protein